LGLWSFEGGPAKAQDRIGTGGADVVVTSLQQVIALLGETNDSNRAAQAQTPLAEEIIATSVERDQEIYLDPQTTP
jgi:hypothetical protein